jgi:ribosomal protein L11 methyltransferase
VNTIKLKINIKDSTEGEILMAILSETLPNGFEELTNELHVFYDESLFHEEEIKPILHAFTYEKEIIEKQNWNALWESNFEPIRVNENIGVRAEFHPPFENCKYDIVITPKMSFGTGHHETTHMMLAYLDDVDCVSKSVLDFGCGTGVLAILSAMKGAHKIMGIDNDNWSILNAIENCERNNVTQVEISNQTIESIEKPFDIILANINLNILVQYMKHLKALLKPDGIMLLSGIMESDLESIQISLQENNFIIKQKKQRKQWIALAVNLTA